MPLQPEKLIAKWSWRSIICSGGFQSGHSAMRETLSEPGGAHLRRSSGTLSLGHFLLERG